MLCVSKSVVGKSGATLTADADVDVDSRACLEVFGLPGDKRDSEEAFFEDMIVEGDYTNDQRLVEVHVSEAAQRIKDLVDWGARIDRLTQAPGHRFPRGIWIPGTEISRVLNAMQETTDPPNTELHGYGLHDRWRTSGGRSRGRQRYGAVHLHPGEIYRSLYGRCDAPLSTHDRT